MKHKTLRSIDVLQKELNKASSPNSDKEKIDYVTNHYSVSGVCGSGVSKAVLKSAGAETADVVLAMTELDEVNLMICKISSSVIIVVHCRKVVMDKRKCVDKFKSSCSINSIFFISTNSICNN